MSEEQPQGISIREMMLDAIFSVDPFVTPLFRRPKAYAGPPRKPRFRREREQCVSSWWARRQLSQSYRRKRFTPRKNRPIFTPLWLREERIEERKEYYS